DDLRVWAYRSSERSDEGVRRAAWIDLRVVGDEEASHTRRRDSGLEGATCVTVEPLASGVCLLEREQERAAARIAEVNSRRFGQLVRERGPKIGGAGGERAELLVRGEHARRRVRRPRAGLTPLEHADIEAALLRAPGRGKAHDPATDDRRVVPLHQADDRLRRREGYEPSRQARTLTPLSRAGGTPTRPGSLDVARRSAPRRSRPRPAARQGTSRRRARAGSRAVPPRVRRARRALRPERPTGSRGALRRG